MSEKFSSGLGKVLLSGAKEGDLVPRETLTQVCQRGRQFTALEPYVDGLVRIAFFDQQGNHLLSKIRIPN